MRINAISVRNLVIGILFSSIALAVLAWPIVSAAFSREPVPLPHSWDIHLIYYVPRFSVGLLLQLSSKQQSRTSRDDAIAHFPV